MRHLTYPWPAFAVVFLFAAFTGSYLRAQQPGTGAPPPPILLDGPKTVIDVGGTITDIVPAGDFQYLALVLAGEKKIVVIDTKTRAVAKELTLPSKDVQVAGTLDHLLVVDNQRRKIEFWQLDGFKKTKSPKSPYDKIHAIACGSRTLGPALVYFTEGSGKKAKGGVAFLHLSDLKPKSLIGPNLPPLKEQTKIHFLPARNGRNFGMWGIGDEPIATSLIGDSEPLLTMMSGHDKAGYVAPNSIGDLVGTAEVGVKDGGMSAKGGAVKDPAAPIVPTSHPAIYMKATQEAERSASAQLTLTFYQIEKVYPLSQVRGVDLGGSIAEKAKTDALSLAKRLHYFLHEKALISIPYSNNKIVFQDYDPIPRMKQSHDEEPEFTRHKREFTIITSIPPAKFESDKPFTYQLTVDTSRKPYYFSIRGTEGVQISKEGLVTWDVPSNFKEDFAEVAIEVTTEGTGSDFQAFKLLRAKTTNPTSNSPRSR